MKVAIMTWYHYRNYGTALQVTALFQTIRSLGYDCDVIQFRPQGYMRSIPHYSIKTLGQKAFRRLTRKGTSATSGKHFLSDEKESAFEQFFEKHISFTKECRTLADLQELNSQYDCFICGSDQIWSPIVFNSRYYLDFVFDNRRMVAYAPSLGVTEIVDPYVKDSIRTLVNRFEHLSVREQEGAKLLSQVTERKAEIVLDPTLLLPGESWNVKQRTESRYALVYFLGNCPEHWDAAAEAAKAKGLALQIIPVFETDLKREGVITEPVGPEEFVSWISGADYVLTDSFHGTVFSLLFRKNFTVFERFRSGSANNQNSRIYNLLKKMNLMSRLYVPKMFEVQLSENIDYDSVEKLLEIEREHSLAYLKSSFEEVFALGKDGKRRTRCGEPDLELCCGCGACVVACPRDALWIQRTENGFWQVQLDNARCIRCGKCLSVCPFKGDVQSVSTENAQLYSYQDSDRDVLMHSSSGGAGYRLGKILLEKGYQIIGCEFDEESQSPKHVLIKQESELPKLQGSKYMQSKFDDALREAATSQGRLAVFGTPCQIAAARRTLARRRDVLYIDFVCHGVPSAWLYKRYREYLEANEQIRADCGETIFRYKPKGWREIHLYSTDGIHEYCRGKDEDLYFRMFDVGNCYMDTCYDCRWRVDSEADIRMADYWGPRFAEDQLGVSMVICFTEAGRALIRVLDRASTIEQPIEDYLEYQQSWNLMKPVFYSDLMKALKDMRTPLPDIVDKYVTPLENRPLSRKEHLLYILNRLLKD